LFPASRDQLRGHCDSVGALVQCAPGGRGRQHGEPTLLRASVGRLLGVIDLEPAAAMTSAPASLAVRVAGTAGS
jgi:hypothetical protein